MQRSRRIRRASVLSFIAYFIVLLALAVYISTVIIGKFHLLVPKNGLGSIMVLLIIFSAISLRGLLLRVKYSLYLSVAILVVSIISFSSLRGFGFIYLIPFAAISLISLILIIADRKYFTFPTRLFDRAEVAVSVVVIVLILIVGVLGSLILGNDFRPKITEPTTALYYTGEVVTTLGFGDIVPVTPLARIFTITISIVGIGSFFGAATIIVAPYLYERGKRVVNLLQKAGSRRLENYVLFVDFSALVEPLIDYLLDRDELVIVAIDDKKKEMMLRDKNLFVESEDDLERTIATFDLSKAKYIVLSSDSDSRNIMNALTIHSIVHEDVKPKVISILNSPANEAKVKPLVGHIISPSHLILENAKKIM
ncbi:MAG: ion channel [Thermoplasmatales archaeon]